MQVVRLWKTSKGVFQHKKDALLKKNRAKIVVEYDRWPSGEKPREDPIAILALKIDHIENGWKLQHPKFFVLSEEVKVQEV